MIKPLAAALALTALLAVPAAAEPPASTEACLKAAIDLAETAEEKELADETRERIERLLITLESHCESGRFPQAADLLGDIEAELAAP